MSIEPAQWLERYGRAWREQDADSVVELFTEDAVYRSHPMRPPLRGREQISRYWRSVTATQKNLELRFGEPITADRRMVAEWWATMRDEGEEVTISGSLILRFDSGGLCEELREYWHLEPRRYEPPEGWGD
ncbi:MAG: nuclear transport factor 2 family protein [Acidimicrobiia bacterium]